MEEQLSRVWQEVVSRPDGPLAMRFYLQPLMALILAVRDGLQDARGGKPAYLWWIFNHPGRRWELIRDGWQSVGKIFVIAVTLDIVYGLIVFRGVRPIETLLVASTLALVPYIVFRGPINRLAQGFYRPSGGRRAA